MWKSLIFLTIFSTTVNGYILSKSDPICRDESFLFYWKSIDQNCLKGGYPHDITGNCDFYVQELFGIVLCAIIGVWIVQFVPIVINFIEGTERRTKCCDERKKKHEKMRQEELKN